jgi:hypothetical protein
VRCISFITNNLRSPIRASEPFSLQEYLKVVPELGLLVYIVMPFVARQLQLEYVPRVDQRRHLHVLVAHVVPPDSRKEFLFSKLRATALHRLPSFELPLVPRADNRDHSPPLRVTERSHVVINIKDNVSVVNPAFDLNTSLLWPSARLRVHSLLQK